MENIAMSYYKPDQFPMNTKGAKNGDDYAVPWPTFWFLDDWMFDQGYGRFNLDPCAGTHNHKLPRFLTKRDDGLAVHWPNVTRPHRVCAFCNPPYNRGALPLWNAKFVRECGENGATVGALLPHWLEDRWAIDYIQPYASRILIIQGRMKFVTPAGQADYGATFGTIFVVWEPGLRRAGTDIRTEWIKVPLR